MSDEGPGANVTQDPSPDATAAAKVAAAVRLRVIDGMWSFFEPELDAYAKRYPWLRDAGHADHPAAQARSRIDAAAKEVIRAEAQSKKADPNERKLEQSPESKRAWAILDEELAQFAKASAPPSPYVIAAEAAKRIAAVAEAARQARIEFEAVWPLKAGMDKGGPPQLSLGSAKWVLAESCAIKILHVFGVQAFKNISSTQEKPFDRLLGAVSEYATGKEPSRREFAEALTKLSKWRRERLALLHGESGKAEF
jgi:hypothetical protein